MIRFFFLFFFPVSRATNKPTNLSAVEIHDRVKEGSLPLSPFQLATLPRTGFSIGGLLELICRFYHYYDYCYFFLSFFFYCLIIMASLYSPLFNHSLSSYSTSTSAEVRCSAILYNSFNFTLFSLLVFTLYEPARIRKTLIHFVFYTMLVYIPCTYLHTIPCEPKFP